MISALFIYSLWCFSVFYLINHADLFAAQRDILLPALPEWARYAVTCSYCSTFWTTLALWLYDIAPGAFVLAAPPIVMFANCGFLRLRGNE